MFQLTLDRDPLSRKDIAKFEHRMAPFEAPEGIGRLLGHSGSQYGGYAKEQRKNWTLIYSSVALKGIIPNNHLGCWLAFIMPVHCFVLIHVKQDA